MDKREKAQAHTKVDGNHTKKLNELYYNIEDPDSFSSAQKFLRRVKKEGLNLDKEDINAYLQKQVAYTRHHQAKYTNKLRRKVLTLRQNECWSGDLLFLLDLKSYNDGYQYVFTNVDLFSKKLWLRALKTKERKEMESAFESIIASNNFVSPMRYWTDMGSEMISMKNIYEKYEIHRYSTNSPLKAVFAEAANKTIENLLYKCMTSKNSKRWIDFLKPVETHLNNSPSPKLFGLSPNLAYLKSNEAYLRAKYIEEYEKFKQKLGKNTAKFVPGQNVRTIEKRGVFSRGYTPNWSKEIHTVELIYYTYPKTYKLVGHKRKYYENELIPAKDAETEIEKNYYIAKKRIVNKRKLRSGAEVGGENQYLLKATNDPSLSTWINERQYIDLKNHEFLR